jgi:hypothetical protein
MVRSNSHGLLPSFLVSFTALFLFAAPLLAAPNERQVTQLADGVYAIEHRFGNSGNTTVIVADRQVFVVDSPNYPARKSWLRATCWFIPSRTSLLLATHPNGFRRCTRWLN